MRSTHFASLAAGVEGAFLHGTGEVAEALSFRSLADRWYSMMRRETLHCPDWSRDWAATYRACGR